MESNLPHVGHPEPQLYDKGGKRGHAHYALWTAIASAARNVTTDSSVAFPVFDSGLRCKSSNLTKHHNNCQNLPQWWPGAGGYCHRRVLVRIGADCCVDFVVADGVLGLRNFCADLFGKLWNNEQIFDNHARILQHQDEWPRTAQKVSFSHVNTWNTPWHGALQEMTVQSLLFKRHLSQTALSVDLVLCSHPETARFYLRDQLCQLNAAMQGTEAPCLPPRPSTKHYCDTNEDLQMTRSTPEALAVKFSPGLKKPRPPNP